MTRAVTLTAALLMLSAAPAAAYTTPFGTSAAWNTPVAGMVADSSSAILVRNLWCGNGCGGQDGAENLNLVTRDFSFPIYYVAGATGYGPAANATCLVKSRTGWTSNIVGKYIPCNPNWKPSHGVNWPAGSDYDSQMIVLNAATGAEYDLWRYSYTSGVITLSQGNLVPGSYWTNTSGYPPSRGSGIPYLATLPVPDEVKAGVTKHALPLAIPNMSGAYRAPATKSDGPWGLANVPAGTRYALAVTDADIAEWLNGLPACISGTGKTSLRTLAVAARDYGWIVTDHAGGAETQLADAANPATKAAWANLGLATQTCSNGKQYPRDALDGLVTQARLVALAP